MNLYQGARTRDLRVSANAEHILLIYVDVIEFDANSQGPWRFRPLVSHVEVHPGELVRVDYDLVNLEPRVPGLPNARELLHSFLIRHVRHSWNLYN